MLDRGPSPMRRIDHDATGMINTQTRIAKRARQDDLGGEDFGDEITHCQMDSNAALNSRTSDRSFRPLKFDYGRLRQRCRFAIEIDTSLMVLLLVRCLLCTYLFHATTITIPLVHTRVGHAQRVHHDCRLSHEDPCRDTKSPKIHLFASKKAMANQVVSKF